MAKLNLSNLKSSVSQAVESEKKHVIAGGIEAVPNTWKKAGMYAVAGGGGAMVALVAGATLGTQLAVGAAGYGAVATALGVRGYMKSKKGE